MGVVKDGQVQPDNTMASQDHSQIIIVPPMGKHNDPSEEAYRQSEPPPQLLHLNHIYNYATKTNMSWWYLMCTKCRQKETGPGWEPPFWQSVCPYPFFPTYRHFASCSTIILLVLLSWGIILSILGDDAAPGGQLFNIARLVIAAYFGGYFFRLFNLPALIGMLMVGIIFQNTGLISVHGRYLNMCGIVRRVALVIILTRAGLDLDPSAMKRLFFTTLKLGLVPWVAEAGMVAGTVHYFLGLPIMWGILVGTVVAAVSPAVIVACLFRLRSKGYGVAKGIPTVVIAISGIDDAASVAAFGIINSLMFSENSLLYNIALGPVSLLGGIGFGVLWGFVSKYLPEKGDPFLVPMRILMLLGGGMIAIFGSEAVGLDGAGPLGVIAAAFVSSWVWSGLGWKIEDNPVATAFEVFWILIEPILFSLTGTQVRFNELDPQDFTVGVGCLAGAAIFRMVITVLVSCGESFNTKEKWFFAVALMAKASVQAALGPIPLDAVRKLGMTDTPEHGYAKIVLMICVLCIALTAPVGAILISLCGPRLLTKTSPGSPEVWRRGTRPSIRDVTVDNGWPEAKTFEQKPSLCNSRKSLSPCIPNVVITQHS